MEINRFSGEPILVNVDGGTGVPVPVRRNPTRGCKRDSSHLVAKALEMDAEVCKKNDKEGGSFYDCNICLDMAKDPVLTCCGHLFCWPCFYQVSVIDATTKECPVCKGEVSDKTVIPIYGNGDGEPVFELESGLKIPPRPKGQRVESVRQQMLTSNGLSHDLVVETLRRIRISISSMGDDQTQEQEGTGGSGVLSFGTEGQNEEASASRRTRIHQVLRVLSENEDSLSSLSSAFGNAENLVEDIEAVINNQILQNDARHSSVDTSISFPMLSGPNNDQPPALAPDINAALPITEDTPPSHVMGAVVRILRIRTSRSEISQPAPTSSTSPPSRRRRNNLIARNSDADNGGHPRDPRRRRLN